MGKNFHEWTDLPDGSRLNVKVEGGEGGLVGFLAESDGDGRTVFESELRHGVDIDLQAPEDYSLGLVFTFGRNSTFTVDAVLRQPDGSEDPIQRKVDGEPGNVKVLALIARTVDAGVS